MIDIKLIQENPAKVAAALEKKGYAFDFSAVLEKDALRRAKQTELEKAKAERNRVSAEIPKLKKEGKPVEPIFEEMRALGDAIAEDEREVNALAAEIYDF